MARLGSEDAKKHRFAALGTRGLSPAPSASQLLGRSASAEAGFLAEGCVAVPFTAWSELGWEYHRTQSPTDETALSIDGFLFVDPMVEMCQRAENFLASRSWSTPSIFCGDQPEPEDIVEEQPAWSMTIVLGLDHIKTTNQDWFSDVTAMLGFVQTLQKELENEFVAEVIYRSKTWYSEHITFVDGRDIDFAVVRSMIDRVT